MPFKFFFSYARDNADKYLEKFYDDLRGEIRQRAGLSERETAFRDTGLQTGDHWNSKLKDALQTSQTFICTISPTYILREFCGKEFQIFHERTQNRLEADRETVNPHNVILPVIWIPIKGDLPEALGSLQLYDADFSPDYKVEGLRYLLKLGKETEYQQFLHLFAGKVIDAALSTELPVLNFVPDFDAVSSAFHQNQSVADRVPDESVGGPNNVKFVFVAAKQQEIQTIRDMLACYHSEGGWFWRPYDPPEKLTVGTIAQQIASDENLRYHEIPFDGGIIEHLRRADEKREIIVLVVDAWSIKLRVYRDLMRLYDSGGFLNCAVLIVWNEQDNETQHNFSGLQDLVTVTFRFRASIKDQVYFKGPIGSLEELRREIRKTLVDLRLKILEVGQAEKRITGQPIPAPMISVPTGDSK
jgi:FxsC-like protein